jgi:hypothetical protein
MKNTKFEPWVGSKYFEENQFGIRILVLGESHYGSDSVCYQTFTTEIVRQFAQKERLSFFTKVSKILLNLDEKTWIDNKTRGEIWEHISFYNYIPTFVGDGSRISPTADLWASAKQPFLDVVQKLSPDVILVLGKNLSSHIPVLPKHINVCNIYHPSSSYFSYEHSNPLFSEVVNRCKSK